jgi:hypothetical protein
MCRQLRWWEKSEVAEVSDVEWTERVALKDIDGKA